MDNLEIKKHIVLSAQRAEQEGRKYITEREYMGLLSISDTLNDFLAFGRRCWNEEMKPLTEKQKSVCGYSIKELLLIIESLMDR